MRKTIVVIAGLLATLSLLLCGCFNAPSSVSVPRNTAQTCRSHCSQLGLRMSAVVIILNSAGCVCEESRSTNRRSAGSSAVAGGAAIQAIHAAQQQQRKK